MGLGALWAFGCGGARVRPAGPPPEYETPESLDGGPVHPVAALAARAADAGRDAR
jgi:hypothetical protein